MDIKNGSRTHGLSLSSIDCQAFVLRHSFDGAIYINPGNIVLPPDMDACKTTPRYLIITREEFTALHPLAEEALLKTEANALLTFSAEAEAKLYPDITARTRTIRTTIPLVLTSYTPAPVSTVDTTETT